MSLTIVKRDSGKLLVGVMGRIASGKSTVANYICTMYGGHYIRFSDTLRQLARDKDIELTQENLQRLWETTREICGGKDDFLAALTASKLSHEIEKSPNDLIVAEGIRMKHDVRELNVFCDSHAYTSIYIFVEASVYSRVARFNERIANDGKGPVDHFTFINKIDNHECESEIESLREYTTFDVDNNGDLDSLFINVSRIMSMHNYHRPSLYD